VSRGPWQIRYTRQAEKDLGHLDPPIRRRVVAAVDRLAARDAVDVILVVRVLPRGRAYR
jgi:mRNA-degrading endonuclease RelE of RelBE toxin-antitoxin system